MDEKWLAKASLYELLARGFRQTTPEFVEVLQSGEYAEALEELACASGIGAAVASDARGMIDREAFGAQDAEDLFHELRRAYTRIFIGGFEPVASPFGGIWWAQRQGLPPLYAVNTESLAVAQTLRGFGLTRPAEKNVPVDHIVAELEFLQYLCARIACADEEPAAASDAPSGAQAADCMAAPDARSDANPREAYRAFYGEHFGWFAHDLGNRLVEAAANSFYEALGAVLAALPEEAL